MAETKQQSKTLALPRIIEQKENNDIYEFQINRCDVSIANALRRTLITDIPCVCFNTEEYNHKNENLHSTIFYENTTSFNNEILKQRLSCIPIHIKNATSEQIENLYVEIKKKNDEKKMEYITTADFKIFDDNTKAEIKTSHRDKIFPPNPQTGDHILFARLKPSVSSNLEGQKLYLRSRLQVKTAKHNGQYNMCCLAAYKNTHDPVKQQDAWTKLENQYRTLNLEDSVIEEKKTDWFIHDANRYFKKNSFDFKVESVGVYSNVELLYMACEQLNKRFTKFISDIDNTFSYTIGETNIASSIDIKMYDYSYTIGKVIEYILHEIYVNDGTFAYVGFIKKHPHDDYSLIRLVFQDPDKSNVENVKVLLTTAANKAIDIFSNIQLNFNSVEIN